MMQNKHCEDLGFLKVKSYKISNLSGLHAPATSLRLPQTDNVSFSEIKQMSKKKESKERHFPDFFQTKGTISLRRIRQKHCQNSDTENFAL